MFWPITQPARSAYLCHIYLQYIIQLIQDCLNLLQGSTDFTETLNRVTVTTLAIIVKTRGISDAEHLLYLQSMLEQILATSTHTWSDKTLCYFPAVLRDALIGRINKRALAIQAWQKVSVKIILWRHVFAIQTTPDYLYFSIAKVLGN